MKSEDVRGKLSEAKRIVVKVGTNSLTDENSKVDEAKIGKLVKEIVELIDSGKDIILVSSGAIGAGVGKLSLDKKPEELDSLQAASTIGQGTLMRIYGKHFEKYGYHVAQLLLTQEDFTNPNRFQNLKNTLEVLTSWGVIPIINENDAVAVDEIRMGDNDLLSTFTATGASADLLVLLTDVDGLCTENPKKSDSAEPIRVVEEVNSEIQDLAKETSDDEFGGIITKVQAAKIATEEGIPVVITDARKENVLRKIIDGEEIGTLFLPKKVQENVEI